MSEIDDLTNFESAEDTAAEAMTDPGTVRSDAEMSGVSTESHLIGSSDPELEVSGGGMIGVSETGTPFDAPIDQSMHGSTSGTVSFGARLDRDAYDELMRQRDEAQSVLEHTKNDAEFLDAYQRKEELQKEMDEMKFNSDEYKFYEESEMRKFDAAVGRVNDSLSRLRRNGIEVSLI